MKFTALFTAFIFCFLAVLPVSQVQAEAEEITPRYMCDVDDDGTVTASDARLILRFAVGMTYTDDFGLMNSLDAVYCDADKSGAIDSADARIALRTAVQLDEPESRAFVVTESAVQSCAADGYIKAECAVTGETVYINFGKAPHSFLAEDRCAGKGVCCECQQMITFAPQHEFSVDPCRGTSRCIECNYTIYYEGHHKYSKYFRCSVCDIGLYEESSYIFAEYLKNNGVKTKDADGRTVYVYEESDEYFTYGLLYYTEGTEVVSYCGMAVEAEGEVLYYDSYYDIRGKYISIDCSTDEGLIASCGSKVDIEFIENGTEYGIDLSRYQSIPELQGQEEAFEVIAGSMSLMNFVWIRDFAQRIDCPDAELLFSDNPAFW